MTHTRSSLVLLLAITTANSMHVRPRPATHAVTVTDERKEHYERRRSREAVCEHLYEFL